jgi:putative aldouronate transport system permease protein
VIAHLILLFLSLCALLPFVLLVVSSFTPETDLLVNGYSYFPKRFTLYAYEYLARTNGTNLLRSYGVTVFITAFGTLLSLSIAPMLAYVISRRDYQRRKLLSFIVLFSMLFNGGLVPNYIMWTQLFHIKNTIWALIFPKLLMSGFGIMLMRNYFQNNIHPSLIEAAKIDGAGEFATYIRVILPLSLPILATFGLMVGISYWNDWELGLYYITDPQLYSVQNLLNRIITSIQFLASMSNDLSVKVEMPSTAVRMAMAVIGVIPILCLYPFFQKYFIKGISLGGVKE